MQLKVHGQNIELTEAISSHVTTRFNNALDQHERRVGDLAQERRVLLVVESDDTVPQFGDTSFHGWC